MAHYVVFDEIHVSFVNPWRDQYTPHMLSGCIMQVAMFSFIAILIYSFLGSPLMLHMVPTTRLPI